MTDGSEPIRLAAFRSPELLSMELHFSAKASEHIRDLADNLHLDPSQVVAKALELGLSQLPSRPNTINMQPTMSQLGGPQ
jgi:hypothetical protein